MGRPLKIAKTQAVITITAVSGSTDLVTTNANFTNLGIIAGMSFVPHTTTGNLVAGTQYWILKVVNAGNNSTFQVSATQLSANPTYTVFDPGTAGPVTNLASVNVVDAYFNNPNSGAGYPATNTATYSVVGGNTAIYGKQVLCSVAIGQNGTGTVFASDADANVFGVGTDFANTVSTGSAIQVAVANINGTTDYVDLGFVSTITGIANVEISNATASGDFLTTVGNAQTLVEDQPVVLTADIGGLTAGTIYYVGTIANAAAFSVSLTPGGANVALDDENAESYAIQDSMELVANAAVSATNASYVFANDEAGYIVRQKGKQKYLVKGTTTGLVAQCFTANVANTALTPNTMSITATYANSSTVKVQSLSDHTVELFTSTSGGPAPDPTNINNAAPAFATFNTAYAANTYGGQPYPIVTIGNA